MKKMIGGTPVVRSDKSLTIMTLDILHSTNGPMDQWTNGPMDQWTNGPMDQCTNGPMDQWTNGLMDQWTNGPMDQDLNIRTQSASCDINCIDTV